MNISLQNKILLTVLLIFGVFSITTFLFISKETDKLNDIFLRNSLEKQKAVKELFELRTQDLYTVITEEYGFWADLAEYIKSPYEQFEKENINWMLEGYLLDGVWVFDDKFKLVHSVNDVEILSNFPSFAPDFYDTLKTYQALDFYYSVDNKLCHFIATSINKSYEKYIESKDDGYIVVAKFIEGQFLSEISSFTSTETSFSLINQALNIDYENWETVFSIPLKDWDDKTIGYLLTNYHSDFLSSLSNSSIYFYALYFLFATFLFVLLLIMMNKLINQPVNSISDSLNKGTTIPIEGLANRNDEFGRIASLIKSFFAQRYKLEYEIENRKKAEKELSKLNENLEREVDERTLQLTELINQSPIAVLVIDKKGRIIRNNEKYEKLFGENISKIANIFDLWKDFNISTLDIFDTLGELFSSKKYFETEPIFVDSNESFMCEKGLWLKIKFYSIEGENGRITNIICLIEDVTELKNSELIKEKMDEQIKISNAILNTQEAERKRISMELHDSIGQLIVSAKYFLSTLLPKTNYELKKNINKSIEILTTASSEVRKVTHSLHPVDLEKYGFIKSLENLCGLFEEISEFNVNLKTYGLEDIGNFKIEINIYRIIQEALNNIFKHAQATEVTVQIFKRENRLFVEIEDSGKGFEFDNEHVNKYSGISNMIYRVKVLGGDYHIESKIEEGTVIFINIPLVKNEN